MTPANEPDMARLPFAAMGTVLTLGFYLVVVIFLGTYILKIMTWGKRGPVAGFRRKTVWTFFLGTMDIISLRRLFLVNPGLWFGEWVFHVSFVMVVARHLRFFLNPVPNWVWSIQPWGLIAGYLLPVSLLYILVMKCIIEKKKYLSSYNFLLIALLSALSLSGLLMGTMFPADFIAIKAFVIGIFTFSPRPAPDSLLFIAHFIFFLIFVAYLPTHIIAAPLVLLEARMREKGLDKVIHEK